MLQCHVNDMQTVINQYLIFLESKFLNNTEYRVTHVMSYQNIKYMICVIFLMSVFLFLTC